MTSDKPIRHGTVGGYTNHACRCQPCTAAHRASAADYRARRKAAGGAHLGRNGSRKAGAWVWSRRPENRCQIDPRTLIYKGDGHFSVVVSDWLSWSGSLEEWVT
jgi:hypothetical protein